AVARDRERVTGAEVCLALRSAQDDNPRVLSERAQPFQECPIAGARDEAQVAPSFECGAVPDEGSAFVAETSPPGLGALGLEESESECCPFELRAEVITAG